MADVSGHGGHVAEFSAALRSLMRKHINSKSQTRLVERLNREFGERARLELFATAVVVTYLANRRSLTVCNAGHPRPLWYRAAAGAWSVLDKALIPDGNLPLGLDDDSPYHQFSVRLEPGDVVLVYTDALTEAADTSGELLGEGGLLDLARGLDPADHARLGPALIAAIEARRGGKPADDDVTLVVLSHNGRGPRRLSVGEKLDVYAKVFGLKAY